MNSTLNPKLWKDNKLKEDVKEAVINIVKEFTENLLVPIDILDIRLVGSNASYNYNKHSDLDIHIVTNFDNVGEPTEVVQALYSAERSNFNRTHDITIKGIDIELYVEDVNVSCLSNGIYSVSGDEWVKEPKKEEVKTKDVSKDKAVTDLKAEIEEVIKSEDSEKIQGCINQLYLLRKDSISTEGEYGYGNLVFKEIRNQGLLDKLKEKYNECVSAELTLEKLEW